ncbi:MAG TPA: glycosyltransferase [Kiritimatiellia bacterium]|nr:glycosyltransferase [Kiritimatiellia bacterium]HRZ12436.1 glycosyltransferase [Kiritimatiellia bacterium]HSA17806.1 glycosyltransferase [Kiritimatiellia bacterium]
MKVLFIAPQPFFVERGTPIRARHQIEVLSRMGHRVDVLCYPFGQPVDLPGVRVLRTFRPPGLRQVAIGPSLAKFPMDFLLLCKAFGLCLWNRYDVIQAVEEAAFFAVPLKKLFRCRLIYNMDSFISDQLQFSGFVRARPVIRLVEGLERAAMRNASYVVTVGPVLSDVVRRWAPRTKVLQLEDAPLEASFREAPEDARRIREEFALGAAPVCVYTGNFERYQGVADLVRAAGLVARQRPEARFLFAGGTEAQVAEMRRLADEAGAGSACVFAGRRPTAEMTAFLNVADLLATPRNQGTNPPMKIYGYMQSGRPIVSTRVPTHTQVLDDSCAFLADPTPEGLAGGILAALGDPDRARAVARAARARVEQRYSLEIFREKVRAAYAGLEAEIRAGRGAA